MMENKQKVLFVCTGNSCRSQIAEGLLNEMAGKYFEVYSAGSHPSRVHPNAISTMKEIKIDISNHTSNSINEFINTGIDIVITVCDDAKQACPIFPKDSMKIHWSIDDPFQGWGKDEEHLNSFRKTRTELQGRIQKFINEMELL
tara:strand:- start:214 stop:645 length:432 start_codon:yes stop_codon:yes gene_type:complete